MRRRDFIKVIAVSAATWPLAALAQTASKVYRIGVFSTDQPLPEPILGAILRALVSHGYTPDRNVALEMRVFTFQSTRRVVAPEPQLSAPRDTSLTTRSGSLTSRICRCGNASAKP